MTPKSLTFEEQLNLLRSRGMIIKDSEIDKLKTIGYYRLKEFAKPLSTIIEVNGIKTVDYNNITFSEVLTRYYQDKNLRNYLMHSIEKVEVAVKTKVSFILGRKYGPFGYLNFSSWCNRKKYSKYTVEQKQLKFKKSLEKTMKHSQYSDIRNKENLEDDGFPSVWLAIDVLMFGQLVEIVEVMSIDNQKELSSFFKCTNLELISWLKCLNLIRNICAHNSNIIDLKLKTPPICRNEWNSILFQLETKPGDFKTSNRIAIVLLILKHLVECINSHYRWIKVGQSIHAICAGKEKTANQLGFINLQSAKNTFKYNSKFNRKNNKKRHKKLQTV